MKVAIYGKKNCKICVNAKKKMKHFSLQEVTSLDEWEEGTWIERDASGVVDGLTDDKWKNFPDVEVLSFIHDKETDKIPLIWIDGDVYFYSEAMKKLKSLKKAMSEAKDPIKLSKVDHDQGEGKMAAMA